MEQRHYERIAQTAHRLWEEAGKPEGQELDFWLRAERITPRIRYFNVLPTEETK